jgi:hypothetical protein
MDCVLVGSLQDTEGISCRTEDPLVLELPSEERDRLYVGAGHRGVGALKELRTGLHTNVTVEFDLGQYFPPSYYRCLIIVSNEYGI